MTSHTATEASKIRTALTAYRVMAWATGIWLIALCYEVVVKYVVQVENPPSWIGVVHGWVYFIYLLATLNLAVKVRWPLWTTLGTLLAGTIPLVGIVLEHTRTQQVKEQFNLATPATPGSAGAEPDLGATERPSPRD
jgi:integral membrane protein